MKLSNHLITKLVAHQSPTIPRNNNAKDKGAAKGDKKHTISQVS